MDILFLAPRPPWPTDTGAKIRTFHLLQALARAHRVTCATFSEGAEDNAAAEELRARVPLAGLEVVPRAHGLLARVRDAARGLVGPLPSSMRKYERAALARVVARLCAARPPALVHCDHLHMAPYGEASRLPFTIDEHNVESLIWRRYARAEKGLRRLAFAEQAFLWTRAEARSAARAWLCLMTSEADRRQLMRLASARAVVVPNGVDLDYFGDLAVPPAEAGAVVLTGSMDWQPNEDAAVWFVEEILPEARRALGALRFAAVGRNPSARVKKLAGPDVVVTGTVPDVRPYLRGALALVVPIRVGGGTRLKILEAFAARVPVVSTRVGAEGIACQHERDVLFAETPAEFAAALARLHTDPALRERLTRAGRDLVEARYGWTAIGRELARVYQGAPRPT